MLKIFSILAPILVGGNSSLNMGVGEIYKNENLNSVYTVVNLKDIKVDQININLAEKPINGREHLIDEVLSEASKQENEPLLAEIYIDTLINPDDWIFKGLENWKAPELGSEIKESLRLVHKNQKIYAGILNIEVKISNTKNNLISSKLKVVDLGIITDTDSGEVMRSIISKNSLNSKDEKNMKIKSINYGEAIVSGIMEWSGEVTVRYVSQISSNWFTSWDSNLLSVKTYSGWDERYVSGSFSYSPTLGMTAFKDYFSSANLNYYLYSYLGHTGVKLNTTMTTSINIQSNSGNKYFFNFWYENVNKEYSVATYDVYWSSQQKLIFDFYVSAKAWASWVNAYNAYAKSQVRINSVTFQKK